MNLIVPMRNRPTRTLKAFPSGIGSARGLAFLFHQLCIVRLQMKGSCVRSAADDAASASAYRDSFLLPGGIHIERPSFNHARKIF